MIFDLAVLHRKRSLKWLGVFAVILIFVISNIDIYSTFMWIIGHYQKFYNRHIALTNLTIFCNATQTLRMTLDEENNIFYILQRFDRHLRNNNIPYFGYYGTLIGAARHGSPAPWDDDIDIIILHQYRHRFENAFKIAEKDVKFPLKLVRHTDTVYKVTNRGFVNVSHKTGRSYSWPYLDIFLATEQTNYLYETVGRIWIKKSEVFPLVTVPFGTVNIRMPRCFLQMAKKMYDFEMCCTGKWIHKSEVIASSRLCVKCSDLYRRFTFVYYTVKNPSTTIMTWKLNNIVIRSDELRIPPCGD